MNTEEQKAFVDSYGCNMGYVNEDKVADFVTRYEANQEIDYSCEQTSIMDALGIWHDAIKWKLNELIKNS